MVIVLSLIFNYLSYSQNSKADELYKKAISKMDDEKDFKGAIKLLDEAIKLDPKNLDLKYEKAYAYFQMEDYKNAAKLLEQLVKSDDAKPVYYQLLGNSYNHLDESDKSNKIYEKGIERFPNSGVLYAGMGMKELNIKEYDKALEWFEKGIEKGPTHASNYYYAALLFSSSTETVWAVLYGEIFMNIERTTNRTEKMSKNLFDDYTKSITFKDSSIAVNFTKNVIQLNDINDLKLPFASIVFETDYLMGLVGEKEISIASLIRVRKRFIDTYFANKQNEKYPNILFDFHKKLIDKGYFECYNYWLFYFGNTIEADKWLESNKTKFDEFIEWFTNNPMEISKDKKFYRTQY